MMIDEAARRLRVVVRAINRRAQRETGPGSPTRSQQAALAWLGDLGELTLGALADAEQVRPQSMGQTVDGLVAAGWVSRRREEGDRRRVTIALTAAGRAALERGRTMRQTWLAESLLSELDDTEREQMCATIPLLERVVGVEHPQTRTK